MDPKYINNPYLKKGTSHDDFDTEKFILEVKKHECIWNVRSKSYNLKCIRNRDIKRRAWEEIAKVFHPDWSELSIEERQKKVDILSRKWANIRKYYTDEVRKPANSPLKKRPRRYHHLLTFLDDTVHKKRVARINEFKNIVKEEINDDSSSDSESGELFIIEDDDELQQLRHRYEPPPTPPVLDCKNNNTNPYPVEKREPVKSFNLWENVAAPARMNNENKSAPTEMVKKNPEIIKLLNETPDPLPYRYYPRYKSNDNNVPKPSAIDSSAEASKRFLLSLLPEIMSLNVRQSLQFRLGIKDLLNDIKLKVNPDVNPNIFPNDNLK